MLKSVFLMLLLVVGCEVTDESKAIHVIGTITAVENDGSFDLENSQSKIIHFDRCWEQIGHFDVWKNERVDLNLQIKVMNGGQCAFIVSSTDLH